MTPLESAQLFQLIENIAELANLLNGEHIAQETERQLLKVLDLAEDISHQQAQSFEQQAEYVGSVYHGPLCSIRCTFAGSSRPPSEPLDLEPSFEPVVSSTLSSRIHASEVSPSSELPPVPLPPPYNRDLTGSQYPPK